MSIQKQPFWKKIITIPFIVCPIEPNLLLTAVREKIVSTGAINM